MKRFMVAVAKVVRDSIDDVAIVTWCAIVALIVFLLS